MSPQTSFNVGSIFYLSITCIFLVYFAYCLHEFCSIARKEGKDKFFKHRHPKLNFSFLLCFFSTAFIIDPLEVVLAFIYYQEANVLELLDVLDDIFSVIIFAFFMSRIWLIFNDWCFHYNISSWIWKRELDPLHANCMIRHRKVFGNKLCCVLLIILLLFLPIVIALDIVPLFLMHPAARIAFRILVVSVLVLFTFFILVSQLKRVLDVYHIRQELLYEMYAFAALWLFSEALTNLLRVTHTINHSHQVLLRCTFGGTISGALVLYIGTKWTLKKYSQYAAFRGYGVTVSHKHDNTDALLTILNTEQGFEAFLFFLVHSLQLEKMLFVIEVLQFKRQIRDRVSAAHTESVFQKHSSQWLKRNFILRIDDRDMVQENDIGVDDDESGMQQEIAALFTIDMNMLDIPCDPRLKQWTSSQFAVHLYDKYIEYGAQLQLNLSSECAHSIYKFFQERFASPTTAAHTFPTPQKQTVDDDNAVTTDAATTDIVYADERQQLRDDVGDAGDGDGGDGDGDDDAGQHYEPEPTIISQHDQDDGDADADNNIDMAYNLFRLYDAALFDIWTIITDEIFPRFKETSEHGKIFEQIYNVRHSEQSNLVRAHSQNKTHVPLPSSDFA
mmetsp:Transcript_6553/g.10378  ORF Transcript_6553/g.10378 Transcript_6553/m.10378 type:complete len:615 (-) Transcript_6553:39-1883(-)